MTSYQKYMAELRLLKELLERVQVSLEDVQLTETEKIERIKVSVWLCKSSLYDLNK